MTVGAPRQSDAIDTGDCPPSPASARVRVDLTTGRELATRLRAVSPLSTEATPPAARNLMWLSILERAFGHVPYLLEAVAGGQTVGQLPLVFMKSALFGRFLVSLPYLSTAGVVAQSDDAAAALIARAVELADELDVRYLELRHELECAHPKLTVCQTSKAHLRLPLPTTPDLLWNALKPKVRNQVRKAQSLGLTVSWGGEERLEPFYRVFAHNMRDLGTPCYGRELFRQILLTFPANAELCVASYQSRPVAAAILDHDAGVTRVPSASSLRRFNWTNANMLMYWSLLERSIERGQHAFDFGRSTVDGNTYRFKKQWGARPEPSVWQYYPRRGSVSDVRPDNTKYRLAISAWQRLPVWLTRWIGPTIVRGIP